MRIRWKSVVVYVVPVLAYVAGHAKGSTIGTVCEGLALALGAFVPAVVTNEPSRGEKKK